MHTKLPNGTRTVIEHPTKGKVAKEILRRYSTGMYSLKSLSKEIEQEFGVKLVKIAFAVLIQDEVIIDEMDSLTEFRA